MWDAILSSCTGEYFQIQVRIHIKLDVGEEACHAQYCEGNCTQVIVELFVVDILNIVMDLIMFAFPISRLTEVQLSLVKLFELMLWHEINSALHRKFQLGFLLCMSLSIVITTAI